MNSTLNNRALRAAIVWLVGVAASAAASAQSAPDFVIDIPAGWACAGFDLRVEIRGGVQVNKEFVDRKGNTVRVLQAGKGSALTFINLNSGASLNVRPNGSVNQFRPNPDGTTSVTSTGHNVLILYPTDVPAGPSTVQHVGRLVYTVDAGGVFRVQSFNGKSADICAALSG